MVHVQGAGWQAGKEAYNCALLYCPQQAVRAMDPRRFCQLRTPSAFRDRARITVCLSHTHMHTVLWLVQNSFHLCRCDKRK